MPPISFPLTFPFDNIVSSVIYTDLWPSQLKKWIHETPTKQTQTKKVFSPVFKLYVSTIGQQHLLGRIFRCHPVIYWGFLVSIIWKCEYIFFAYFLDLNECKLELVKRFEINKLWFLKTWITTHFTKVDQCSICPSSDNS